MIVVEWYHDVCGGGSGSEGDNIDGGVVAMMIVATVVVEVE